MKSVKIGLAIALVVAASAVAASADSKDAWLTTKAKIALLTTEGVSVTAVNVDTVNGKITMHGKVGTAAEKTKAGATIQALDGVKSVNNLLQVVPQDQKKMVDLKDADVKDSVEASLKAAKTMDDIKVASVNKGVVLLSGKSPSLDQKLLVIERVYTVDGVQRVATEIEVLNP